MATIESTLALNDKMTSTLRSITTAMDSTLTAMRSISDQDLGADFGKAQGDVKRATMAIDDLEKSLNQVNDTSQKVKSPFDSWGKAIVVVNQGLELTKKLVGSIKGLVEKTVSAASEQIRTETLLQIPLSKNAATSEEFLHNYEKIVGMSNELEKSTSISGTAFLGGSAELATYLSDVEALNTLMPTLADYAVGMAGDVNISTQEMINYATQLGKALEGSFDGLAKKGFVPTEAQKQILQTGTEMERVAVLTEMIDDSWGGLAEAMANTPVGAINRLNTELGNMWTRIGNELMPIVGIFATFFTENLHLIETAIMSVISFAVSNIDILINALMALGVIALVAGIMAMLPFIKIIALVLLAAKILSMFGITVEDVILFIGKLLIKLGVGAHNLVLGVGQAVTFIVSKVADGILAILEWTTSKLDKFLGTDWSSGISNMRGKIEVQANKIAEKEMKDSEQYIGALEDFTDSLGNALDNLRELEIGDGGLGLEKLLGENGLGGGMDMEMDFPTNMLTSGGAGGGTALKTKNVEPFIKDEDIRLLSDIATRDYKLNYKQVTPQISMTFGDIRETVDADKIINHLANAIEDLVDTDLGVVEVW